MLRRRNRGERTDGSEEGVGAKQYFEVQEDDDNDQQLNDCSPYNKEEQEQEDTLTVDDDDYDDSNMSSLSSTHRLLTSLWILWHIVSVGLVVYGVILSHAKLFHHEECDMTWSRRIFFPLQLSSSSTTKNNSNMDNPDPPYRLFQFLDARDVRFRKLLSSSSLLSPPPMVGGREGCWNTTWTRTAVLYVPGHGGSYEQSRSLGAHGVQWTSHNDERVRTRRIQQGLLHHQLQGTANDTEHFAYPVYAVDFQQEGTGLHGIFVQQQADFIARAIRQLTTQTTNDNADHASSCQYESVLIVAHSMGGYAARLAYQQNPDVRSLVRNLITLGTPHAHPVLAVDPSIHEIYRQMVGSNDDNDDDDLSNDHHRHHLSIVSISGGLRDEMIPPESCQLVSSSSQQRQWSALSLLAPRLMRVKTSWSSSSSSPLGMDHRAIVWCHNLLEQVRIIIFWMGRADVQGLNSKEKLELVRNKAYYNGLQDDAGDEDDEGGTTFQRLVQEYHQTLASEFGWWNAVAMEAGFLYNAEALVNAYVILGCLYLALGCSRNTSFVASSSLFIWLLIKGPSRMSIFSKILITFTANALFWIFMLALRLLQIRRSGRRLVEMTIFGLLLFFFALFVFYPTASGRGKVVVLTMGYCFYLWLLLTLHNGNDSNSNTLSQPQGSPMILAAWSLPLLAILSIGNIYANWKRPNVGLNIAGTDGLHGLLLLCCCVYLIPSWDNAKRPSLLSKLVRVAICVNVLCLDGFPRTVLNPGGSLTVFALSIMAEGVLPEMVSLQ
mmetsp:Transcript_11797/g.32704  ORF Transcript_11797/g.32704 Transcript_11797/m.32704 type:complete len:776 (-) Transcript_11797:100-2427(-)